MISQVGCGAIQILFGALFLLSLNLEPLPWPQSPPSTSSLAGTVRDSTDAPVVGAVVVALRVVQGPTGERQFVAERSDESDDRGQYRLHTLRAGRYVVGVLPSSISTRRRVGEGQEDVLAATAFHPQAATPFDAMEVTLSPGENRLAVDVQSETYDTVVRGTLRTTDGSVGRGTLRLFPVDSTGLRSSWSVAAYTAGDGNFEFAGVRPGIYQLRVYDTDPRGAPTVRTSPTIASPKLRGLPREGSVSTALAPSRPALWAETDIHLREREPLTLDVVMRPALTVHGHLEFDSSSQGAQDLGGYVVAARSIGSDAMNIAPLGVSDTAGEFVLSGLPPGSYVLTVSGKPGATVESINLSGHETRFNDFTLKDGTNLDLTVKIGRAPGKIVGTVSASSPDVLKGGWVYMLPRDAFPSVAAAIVSGRMRRTAVASDGTFRFDNVPSGQYLVAADARQQDVWAIESVLKVLRADAVPVAARSGGVHDLRLRLTGK